MPDESSHLGRWPRNETQRETATRPKPMVDLGGKPILWHILKTYAHHGVNDFVICCG